MYGGIYLENKGLSVGADEEITPYHCCAEWHLSKIRSSPACALIYSFALRISRTSRKFSCSAISVAEFFGLNEKTVRRAYRSLVAAGFFILLERGTFESNMYRVLTHNEWKEMNPHRCAVKAEFPCTGEGDPLGQK